MPPSSPSALGPADRRPAASVVWRCGRGPVRYHVGPARPQGASSARLRPHHASRAPTACRRPGRTSSASTIPRGSTRSCWPPTWPDRERRALHLRAARAGHEPSGWRNHLITWTGRGVPFKPGAQDVIDRPDAPWPCCVAVSCLAVAGEGRLSDHEGRSPAARDGPRPLRARWRLRPIVPDRRSSARAGSTSAAVSASASAKPVHPTGFPRGQGRRGRDDRAIVAGASAGAARGRRRPATHPAGSVGRSPRPSTTAPGWTRLDQAASRRPGDAPDARTGRPWREARG